jgi:hypothetical protein
MAYREPGVYLEVLNNPRGGIIQGIQMVPTVIGTGAKKFKATVTMTRASGGQDDTFPYTSVLSITHIGTSKSGASTWIQTTDPMDPQDYTFVEGDNFITWEPGKEPADGTIYYATVVYAAEASQYTPRAAYVLKDVIDNYGPDIQENEVGTPICPISLAAQLVLLAGAPVVNIIQVEAAGDVATAEEYSDALDTYAKFIPSIWRLIPVDQDADVQAVVKAHIELMSTTEERMERCTFFGKPYTILDPAPTTFDGNDGVLTKIGDYAQGIENTRVTVIYPDVASRTLSDGSTRDLDAPFILAAIAGTKSSLPTSRSMTRMGVTGFANLKGVRMTRSQKNALAEKGVMVLEQAATNSPIIVRHQLTTNMYSTQSRENSILEIQDYCSKQYRLSCEPYIGKYNITSQLITQIKATLNTVGNQMIKDGIIVSAKVDTIYQDADNPDTIIVSLSVLPPYPCNYIDITLVLE